MEVRFVAHTDDLQGRRAAEYLKQCGYASRILEMDERASPTDIALFGAQDDSVIHSKYLSMCPYKFEERCIKVPEWASSTPFQVAIRLDAPTAWVVNYHSALRQLAYTYKKWSPWMELAAPWNPTWTKGPPPESYVKWQRIARERVAPPPFTERIGRYLTPVFAPAQISSASTLVVIGCAAFNRPHTDLVDELVPGKMETVTRHLSGLVRSGGFENVEVVVAEADILLHPILRNHLHPFIYMAVAEAEGLLKKSFNEPARLWGRNHRRSIAEIGESFTASADAMRRQLIEPLQAAVGVPVRAVSWYEMILPYLEEAEQLVDKHQQLLRHIYLERVRTRPSYSTLHDIDPTAGFGRTFGNAVLYVAEALYLRNRSDCVLANFEANEVYWQGLASIVEPLWSERVPYIGMVEQEFRQPWGY